MKHGKVWGATRPLVVTPLAELHWLDILPRSRCSFHCHRHKWNAFVVLRGEITVEVEQQAYALTDATRLLAGEATTVAPGLYHRFVAGAEGATIIEAYYPQGLAEDIVRRDVGARPREED